MSRRRGPGSRGRIVIALTVAAVALAGCSSAAESGTAPAQSVSSAAAEATPADDAAEGAATPAPLPLLDGPIGSVSTPVPPPADFADRVSALGLDDATAFFLSQTVSTVDVVDGHTFVVSSEFLNGATAEATYRLYAPATMSPDDPPVVTAEVDGDELRYTMEYAISTEGMPAGMQEQIDNGLPDARPASTSQGAVIRLVADDGGAHTLGVFVDGVVSQSQETAGDVFVEKSEKILEATGKGQGKLASGSWNAYKAGNKVWDALNANEVISTALAELDALEKCAKDPTNPVTKQEYGKNPSAQQGVLDTIADARSEIKANTAVLFTTLVADTASGLVAEAPWLGFIVSPAVNYVKDTLTRLLESEMDRARQAVVPCRPRAYTIKGTIPSAPIGIFVEGIVCALDRPFLAMTDGDLVGKLSFAPRSGEAGSVTFKGKVGNAPLKATGEGKYTVSLSPDGASGTIDFPFKSTIHIPVVGDQPGGGPVSLTLTETHACDEVPRG